MTHFSFKSCENTKHYSHKCWVVRERSSNRVSDLSILATVQLLTVVEDVVIRGVEAGFDTVSHNLTGSRGTLQFLDLSRVRQ